MWQCRCPKSADSFEIEKCQIFYVDNFIWFYFREQEPANFLYELILAEAHRPSPIISHRRFAIEWILKKEGDSRTCQCSQFLCVCVWEGEICKNGWLFWGVTICRLTTLHKKWSFLLRISSVNVTKSAGNCGFGHIYWRNPQWKTSFFMQCYLDWCHQKRCS